MTAGGGLPRGAALLLAATVGSCALAADLSRPDLPAARTAVVQGEQRAARIDAQCRGKDLRSRVIPVRFKPVAEAAAVVERLLSPCGAYRAPKTPKQITVTDESEPLRKITQALALWDLPPRAVDISVALILASRGAPGAAVLPALPGVPESLAQLTRFTRFEQLGAAMVRAMEGNETQARLGDTHWVKFTIESVDAAHAVVRLAAFDLYQNAGPNEGRSSPSLPRRLLGLLEVNLPEGRESLVGAPGRGGERALFVALKAATVPPAQVTAAGVGE